MSLNHASIKAAMKVVFADVDDTMCLILDAAHMSGTRVSGMTPCQEAEAISYNIEYIGEKAHGNSIMAAVALVQLRYLDRDNAYRRQLATWYHERLGKLPELIKLVKIPANCESSCHFVDNTNYPMYSYAKGTCPRAAYVSEHALSLPMHMDLSFDDVQFICDEIVKFVKQ